MGDRSGGGHTPRDEDVSERLRRVLRLPRRLTWNERHRHRFLAEYHEMKARAAAELYLVGGRLTWSGSLPSAGARVEWAIRYHPSHPVVMPSVHVLAPAAAVLALNGDAEGRVQVLAPEGWHGGLTAFDLWLWLRDLVAGLAAP